jgi:phosphoserine phosphatase RsbX
METLNGAILEYGVASHALRGEQESGDQYLVKASACAALVAVIDGLGHGPEAAGAAKLALAVLDQHSGEGVIALLRHCHSSLVSTRGAVMSLAVFDATENTMVWSGIGNVEGRLIRASKSASSAHEALVLRGGVVGGKIPPLRASVIPVSNGDTLIFATDGITAGFSDEITSRDDPQEMATNVLTLYNKGTDDALVLVARYLGRPH